MTDGLAELFEEILAKRTAALNRNAGAWPRTQPVASDLSSCAREMALAVLHWKDRPGFDTELLARFEKGTEAEAPTYAKLAAYGFPVIEQQRTFELKGRRGGVVLRGRIDGKIRWNGRAVPFDLKTVDPLIYPRLSTVDDLLGHPFFSKWVRQLWSYELLNDIDTGFLLLDNLKGAWKFIEVPLDYAAMEQVLANCEAAVEAVQRVTRENIPEDEALPPHTTDLDACRRCWARGRVCFPAGLTDDGVRLLEDAELEAALTRRAELEPGAKEYDAVDKTVKDAVRGQPRVLVGDWLITGKELVVNYKAKEAQSVTQWRTKIDKLTPATPDPAP